VEKIGKGVEYELDEVGILTIKINTNVNFGLSSTGKSTIVASSSGNKQINIGTEISGDRIAYLGLNLYIK